MIINTWHMSGAGNTFVMIDDTARCDFDAQLVPFLVNRFSIGQRTAEGVVVLTSIHEGGFNAAYYNPDGTVGMMCGNGGRCAVRFALDRGAQPDEMERITFRMAGATYTATFADTLISVDFPAPKEERLFGAGELAGIHEPVPYYNVNSDHVVLFGNPRDTASDPRIPLLRHHPMFPRGVNVNVVRLMPDNTIELATFERGVEDVTGACGTGAISAALAVWRIGGQGNVVRLIPPSGRPLTVIIHHDRHRILAVTLKGDAIYDHAETLFDTTLRTYIS